ncbi:sulfotransferase family 2 domain-containing protein [Bacillus sp. JJ1562]|uniref:sulfotransferase family 2 domain-containing protein n=1 Tax=Bacillus sp. JJ1562 TaxID=3122960 RepID=UPI003002E512
MRSKEELLIFLHIQKTAGSSFKTFLKNQFNKDQIWFDRSSRVKEIKKTRDLQCIGGHFAYGVHENFNLPYTYVTMLREPVDRVLSYYYFVKEKKEGVDRRISKMDIKEFMDEYQAKTCNYQTRRIAGDKVDLELAKKHLLEEFSFVGITERFKESIFLMQKEYNFPSLSYETRNITKKRASTQELPEEIISYIKQQNQLDIELYKFAKELFERKLKTLTKKEKEQLLAFLNEQK